MKTQETCKNENDLHNLIKALGYDCLSVDTAAHGWPYGDLRLVWTDGTEERFSTIADAEKYVRSLD